MTGTSSARWTVAPTTAPRPWRHCSTCNDLRPFISSGRIRLNANGRRLDAWLIYRCAICDRTWNRPLAERLAVAAVPEAALQAMQRNDPGWVRAREFDLAALRRYCERVELSPEVAVTRAAMGSPPASWLEIRLAIEALHPTGQRLDRLLAAELGLSRAALQAMQRAGGLVPEPASRAGLRRTVGGRLAVRFVAARLAGAERAALPGRIFG